MSFLASPASCPPRHKGPAGVGKPQPTPGALLSHLANPHAPVMGLESCFGPESPQGLLKWCFRESPLSEVSRCYFWEPVVTVQSQARSLLCCTSHAALPEICCVLWGGLIALPKAADL